VKTRMTCAAALMAVALACAATAPAIAADPDILARGSQWMSLRAGYVKVTGDVAPNGLVGGGFGYRRFVLNRWSVGAFASYELLGRFDRAAEIQVPLAVEVVRHSRWGAAVYPYVGVGAGAFYHKLYRTGEDVSNFSPGRYLTAGAQAPVSKNSMLGVDIRLAQVERPDDNPSFPGASAERAKIDDLLTQLRSGAVIDYNNDSSKMRSTWSIKFDYTITY
jgi:hypothetical protein